MLKELIQMRKDLRVLSSDLYDIFESVYRMRDELDELISRASEPRNDAERSEQKLACSCGGTALMPVLLCDDCGAIIMPPISPAPASA